MKRLPASAILSQVKAAGPIEIIMVLCALTLIIVSHAVKIWTLDKSFIPADEGWMMFLQANSVNYNVARGHLIFRFFPILNDLFYNRIAALLIFSVAQFTLAYGFYRWIKSLNLKCNLIIIWGLVCMFGLHINIMGCAVLNYPILTDSIASISIGFALIGISNRKPIYFSISGFFISLLIPIKITSIILAPVLLITIISVSNKPWRDLIYSFLGFIMGFIIYLLFFDTPKAFLDAFLMGFNSTVDGEADSTHSLDALISWIKGTLWCYFMWTLTAYIIFWIPKSLDFIPCLRNHKIIYNFILSFSILFILIYVWLFGNPVIHPHNYTGFLINTTWILTILTILYALTLKPGKYILIPLMLTLAPFCVTFGTDVLFTVRSLPMYICIIPALYVILPTLEQKIIKTFLLILLILSICNMIYPPTKDGKYMTWNRNIYSDQNVTLAAPALRHPIKVDNKFMEYFNFYRENIPQDSFTIGENQAWGAIYLLKLNNLNKDFRASYDSEQLAACKLLINNNIPLYLIWNTAGSLWTSKDQDTQIATLEKYLDYFKQHGYNIILKNKGDYHLAIVEPKRE